MRHEETKPPHNKQRSNSAPKQIIIIHIRALTPLRSPSHSSIRPIHQLRLTIPQNNQPLLRRRKLPQLNPGLPKNPRRLLIHIITLAENHLRNPHLHNLDTTSQTRASVAIQHRAPAYPIPPRLQQSILLGVNAQTRRQRLSARRPGRVVAARTPAGRAVGQVPRRAVVAGADDAVGAHEHAADLPPHAV
jgi:hypothetical protein